MIRGLALCLLGALGFGAGAQAQLTFPGFYPEGPVWIGPDLYWAEMQSDTVFRLDGDSPEPWFTKQGCGPTALAKYREDEVIVLCHLSGRLLRLSADGTELGEITTAGDGTRLRNPNDASADPEGGVWFTDPGRFSSRAPAEGRLYRLAPDGSVTLHAEDLAYGNGIYVDPAGGRLLLSEHLARQVLTYPLKGTNIGAPSVLVRLDDLGLAPPRYPESGPDGLEIGPDGTLWIAEYGTKRLLGWRPDRGLAAALEVDAPYVTNIAFGPDGRAAITGSYTNTDPRNRGGIWVFDAKFLTDAAAPLDGEK